MDCHQTPHLLHFRLGKETREPLLLPDWDSLACARNLVMAVRSASELHHLPHAR